MAPCWTSENMLWNNSSNIIWTFLGIFHFFVSRAFLFLMISVRQQTEEFVMLSKCYVVNFYNYSFCNIINMYPLSQAENTKIIYHLAFPVFTWKCHFRIVLTLILLKPKVINFCHEYRARPVCTSMQSVQALYCCLTYLKFSTRYP